MICARELSPLGFGAHDFHGRSVVVGFLVLFTRFDSFVDVSFEKAEACIGSVVGDGSNGNG